MLGLIAGLIGAVGSIATSVASIGLTIQGLKILFNVVVSLGKALGFIKTEKPEVLGDKAIQAEEAGIVPENYETYQQYVDEVEAFEVDTEKSAFTTEEEKLLKAVEISCILVGEQLCEPPVIFKDLFTAAGKFPEYFVPDKNDPVRLTEIIKAGPDTMKLAAGYFNGNETDPQKMESAVEHLAAIDHKLAPEKSDSDIRSEIVKASLKDM